LDCSGVIIMNKPVHRGRRSFQVILQYLRFLRGFAVPMCGKAQPFREGPKSIRGSASMSFQGTGRAESRCVFYLSSAGGRASTSFRSQAERQSHSAHQGGRAVKKLTDD
jgi:hypothetical protein